MKRLGLAICSPDETSTGGEVFVRRFAAALAECDGINPVLANHRIADELGLAHLSEHTSTADLHSLHFGARVTPGRFASVTFWPLSVAAVEKNSAHVFGESGFARARSGLMRLRLRRSIRRANSLIFSSNYTRDRYAAKFGRVLEVPSSIIPTGAGFRGVERVERCSTSSDIFRVLWASNAYHYKNLNQTLDGFEQFRLDSLVPSEMAVAGQIYDDPTGRRLRETSQDPASGVKYLGSLSQEKLLAEYRDADLFLFTSRSENCGSFALADAFLLGVPVISSDRSSMPEFCGEGACMIDPDSSEQISHALMSVATDPAARAALTIRSIARGKTLPSWNEIALQAIEHIRRVETL